MLEAITPAEWTTRHAAHLLDRAAFGATPAEIETVAKSHPEEIVDRLLAFPSGGAEVKPSWLEPDLKKLPDRKWLKSQSEDFRKEFRKKERIQNSRFMEELQGWWLNQMRSGPYPLREKLTLFWHGHFATGVVKVKNAYAMYLQNEMLRSHAHGNWKEMLLAVSRDPAMLRYLDNAISNKRRPNENYARELMELFSLGEGHYSEKDIQEAARAFTGWTINRKVIEFEYLDKLHDEGEKTFLGKTGKFGGEDIVRMILEQKQAPRFITAKLWSHLAYPNPEPELVEALAGELVRNDWEWKPTLKTLLLSREFYSPKAIGNQIKGPVQWLVQACRALECDLPHPFISTFIVKTLGQELFNPPNVKGWDEGPAWINTADLLNRYQAGETIVVGGPRLKAAVRRIEKLMERFGFDMKAHEASLTQAREPLVDPARLLSPKEWSDPDTAVEKLSWRLYHRPLPPEYESRTRAFFSSKPNPSQPSQPSQPSKWGDPEKRQLIAHMMSSPLYQLT